MTRHESRARATETLARYRESGLSRKAFCAAESLSSSTLSFWLRRERAESKNGDPAKDRFVPVAHAKPVPHATSATLTIVFGDGTRLEATGGYPTEHLCRVAASLARETAC